MIHEAYNDAAGCAAAPTQNQNQTPSPNPSPSPSSSPGPGPTPTPTPNPTPYPTPDQVLKFLTISQLQRLQDALSEVRRDKANPDPNPHQVDALMETLAAVDRGAAAVV